MVSNHGPKKYVSLWMSSMFVHKFLEYSKYVCTISSVATFLDQREKAMMTVLFDFLDEFLDSLISIKTKLRSNFF